MTDPRSKNEKKKTLRIAIGADLVDVFRVIQKCRRSLLLVGDSGIGKSEFVRAWAEASGLKAVVLNMALFEGAGELLGLPRLVDGQTDYAIPAFLPTKGTGVLILEELTRVAPHVTAALYEFLTTRRLGSYELPPGWIVVACANKAARIVWAVLAKNQPFQPAA